MGCGYKKKNNDNPQPTEGQATATVVADNQTTQQQTNQGRMLLFSWISLFVGLIYYDLPPGLPGLRTRGWVRGVTSQGT